MIRYVNISLECFGSLISLLIIISIFAGEYKKDPLNKKTAYILICNILVLLSDTFALIFKGDTHIWSYYIVRIANFGVYVFSYFVLIGFTEYLIGFLNTKTKVPRTIANIMWALSAVAVTLVIVSQWTHIFYYIDELNIYHRQSLFWVSQMWGILCLIMNIVLIIKYYYLLNKREKFILLSYTCLPIIAMIIQIYIYGLALLNLAITISCLNLYLNIQFDQAKKTKEIELELEKNKIEMMINQIKPHFLYNTLSTIRYLCQEDPIQAQEAINQFSQFLRLNIEFVSNPSSIPFQKELEHVQNYLNIEQLRFKERLNVIYKIESQDFWLPALTLQPIVENAVNHGILKKQKGGTLCIQTQENKDCYRIIVEDDGVGFQDNSHIQDSSTHIGIENVRSRLKLLCHGELIIESEIKIGTKVMMVIPKGGKTI